MKIKWEKRPYAVVGFCLCFSILQAQTDADLLRYSMLNVSGNARFNAMGGAFGALGANFTALSTNPAAIGLYSRHEISVTGAITSFNTKSNYYGNSKEDQGIRINMPSVNGVFCVYENKNTNKNSWRRVQVAVGMNRLSDFNSASAVQGFNKKSSYMEDVAARANGIKPSSLGSPASMAWNTGLLDVRDTNSWHYVTALAGGNLEQKQLWETSGNISELVFSVGGNYSDQLYIGATIGVPFVHYSERSSISETNTEHLKFPYSFQSYTYHQNYRVSGAGVNLKLGLIYKPFPFFRIGLAFHTPTYYSLSESYQADISTEMSHPENLAKRDAISSNYGYKIYSPAKGLLSLGFVIGNFGVIGLEGELLNYKGMRANLGDDPDYENNLNRVVKNNYQMAGVFKAGTEWKVSIVRLRAGYIYQSCPYKDKDIRSAWSDNTITAGLGLALGAWNIDFGFMYNMGKQNHYIYNLVDGNNHQSLVEAANLKTNKYMYSISLSAKF